MEDTKYGKRREGRWTPIRAKAQDTRASPNSWETRLVRKRWDIGLLRALSLRIMMMILVKTEAKCISTASKYRNFNSLSYFLIKVTRILVIELYSDFGGFGPLFCSVVVFKTLGSADNKCTFCKSLCCSNCLFKITSWNLFMFSQLMQCV